MPRPVVELEMGGMNEVQKALRGLRYKVRKRVLRASLRKSLHIVTGSTDIPTDEGELEATQKIKTSIKENEGVAIGRVIVGGGDKFYALFLEKGTRERYTGAKFRSTFGGLISGWVTHSSVQRYTGAIEPPQRFMARALYKNEREIKAVFVRVVKEQVAKVKAAGGAR